MTDSLKELFGLGFSLIPLSGKMPIDKEWTKAPKKEWAEIKRLKAGGANVGVRLGSPTKMGGGYLAVIDCDVKSTDEKHQKEMLAWLDKELPGCAAGAPCVLSGRGNGSRHYYLLTDKPVTPKRLTQSKETVTVFMPSAKKPSKRELETLSQADISSGFRLRPAWEISLMGEGQQVVLPPSIHPDSKKPYVWSRPLHEAKSFGAILSAESELFKNEQKEKELDAVNIESFEKVELAFTRLDSASIAMIEEGEGVEDRSGSLLTAAMQMVRAGFTDSQILSVLTDPDYYLGGAAYDHAQTHDRKRAAKWIEKYTLRKARVTADPSFMFDGIEESDPLSDEEATAQAEELLSDASGDWRSLIERVGGKEDAPPKVTLKNILLILSRGVDHLLVRYDEFSGREVYGADTPWGGVKGKELSDIDLINIKVWFAENFRFEPATALVNEAVSKLAHANRFHPVRDYLRALEWDGVSRAETWLNDYFGCKERTPYIRAVARKTLCALVARVMEPGVKFDYVPIMEGMQGVRKSTALGALVGPDWFSDATIDISDKDAILAMRGKWLIEMGELSSFKKADIDLLKQFLSRTVDRIRLPYGRRSEDFPRQCVFVGSTNNDEYLKDDTGNRRFWPIHSGLCDVEGIKAVRDQLFAEAYFLWGMGEPLYLDEKEAAAIAFDEQHARVESDVLEEQLQEWFSQNEQGKELFAKGKFKISELLAVYTPLGGRVQDDKGSQIRFGRALKRIGFSRVVFRIGKTTPKFWVKNGNVSNSGGNAQ